MSYMEEVFQRAEQKFSDIEQQIGWLSSFKDKPGNAYERDAVRVAEQLQSSVDIIDKAESARTLKDLKNYQKQAQSLKYGGDTAQGDINERLRVLEGEASELADTIKTSRSFSEVEKATEELRELSPQKLGGIKSGQVRFRGSKKEQKIIGDALGFVLPIEESEGE